MQGDIAQLRSLADAIDKAWEIADAVTTRAEDTERENNARQWRNELEHLHCTVLDYIDEAKKGTVPAPFRQPVR